MHNLIAAIQASCAQQNWYAALYMASRCPISAPSYKNQFEGIGRTLSSMVRPMREANVHEQVSWDFHFLTAGDCWALRCSLLHERTDEITTQKSQEGRFVKFNFHFQENSMQQYMIGKSMRFFFLFAGSTIWAGMWLTGFSVVHWLLYIPAVFFYFAAITGICPGLIISRLVFGDK